MEFEATKCEKLRMSRTKRSFSGSSMSRLDSLVSCSAAVSMGDAAKPLLYCMFSKQVLMSFCLAGVPLRDIHSYSF